VQPRARPARLALALAISSCSEASPALPIESSDAGSDAHLLSTSLDRLSDTGLYATGNPAAGLSPGVLEYTPRFAQWVDGASHRRFLWLPPGAPIDASDPDHWTQPVGTRAWQELSRNGRAVETRFMQKVASDEWRFMTYHWAEPDDATLIERGLTNASGTGHDIPHLVDCGSCHDNVPDRLLGIGTLQLAHGDAGLSLSTLVSSDKLSPAPAAPAELPGDAVTRAALGYLHANCGSCHNPSSVEYRSVDLELWLSVSALRSVAETPAHRTAVGVARQGLGAGSPLPELRIAPGDPTRSALYHRMASRDPNVQMPPVGTKQVDTTALDAVGAWIAALVPP
jgi:hypothetical protein